MAIAFDEAMQSGKVARTFAVANYDSDNPYERRICQAARSLVNAGKGEYQYTTQWSSGTTLWHKGNEAQLTVDSQGVIGE